MANITWNAGVSGNFATGSNWRNGTVPGAADTAEIVVKGTYTVSSSTDETVDALDVGGNATLDIASGTFDVAAGSSPSVVLSLASTATIDIGDGATLLVPGGNQADLPIDGLISVASGGTIQSTGGFVLTGGTLQMGGASAQLIGGLNNFAGSTVEGGGAIILTEADDGINNYGVINANSASAELNLAADGTADSSAEIGNSGTLEATDGAGLLLSVTPGPNLFGVILLPGSVMQAVGPGSHIDLDDATLLGSGTSTGELTTSGGGIVQTLAGGAVFEGVVTSASVRVNDGTTLSLYQGLANTGTISLDSTGNATDLRITSLVDYDPAGKDTLATRTVTLSGDGAITLSDNAANLIYATHATDVLINDGNTISGAGQIGGGFAMTLINSAVIDATGVNALVIDIGAGRASNGIHSVLEGSGAGGLSITGGTFTTIGAVEALNGGSVTFGEGAILTNDAGGTLTGGTWSADAAGHGATLSLSGPAITNDAAQITLSGVGSVFDTGAGTLEQSLTTIAAKGKLELLAGRGWTTTNAVTDAGLLQLGGGTFTATSLTVGAGGTVSGVGAIDAPLTNDGLVEAGRGAFSLTGAVTGTGTLEILSQTTLDVGGSVAATQTVLFGAGVHANLELASPSAFAGVLKSWAIGDTIDLAKTDVTSAQISGDTLAIDLQGGGTLDYTLANPPSGARIVLSSDGAGGTNLTLYKAPTPAPAVALLSQSMAAMAVSAGAGTAVPAAPADTRLAMITTPSHA